MKRFVFGMVAGVVMLAAAPHEAAAQFQKKWVSAGSLHNWYASVGAEAESQGFVGTQQDGLRWPGIYDLTDTQAMKGLWIGARNPVPGVDGSYFVVHAGPRVTGTGEFFPTRFELVSRFDLPEVLVDGELSEGLAPMVVERVDPSIPSDVMLVTEVNTLLGLTMERRVLQFSQPFHDNYHVVEYTFTNTGNTDGDAEVERPGQTLEDIYVAYMWRWSVAKETRYVIDNSTGWGINTMVDYWGDGVDENLPAGLPGGSDAVRAHYAWQGFFPNFQLYNNIGGPILPEALPATQIADTDTLGRLAAYQFVGAGTLFAPTAPGSGTNDPAQPVNMSYIHSDDPLLSNNDAFVPAKSQVEYEGLLARGRQQPSHAYRVEPTGLPGWIDPTIDPSLGTSGGHSAVKGFGPYTLQPGESFRIVMVEAASGISREAADALGRAYKAADADDDAALGFDADNDGQIEAGETMTKNEWVFTGRDSLYQTFQRAIANYESGYAIPQPPLPPSFVEVTSAGDRIIVAWDVFPEGTPPEGFEVYRARSNYDSTYTRIAELGPEARSFDDATAIRGVDYYYYVVAVQSSGNDGTGLTPAGVPLRSSRYFTQTYTPARLRRQQGEALADIRVVPNPFNAGASPAFQFGGGNNVDRLGFLNIPGRCRIDIMTEVGERVETILHTDGSGDAFWDLTTYSNQVVASGLYIAVFTVTEDIPDPATGALLFREGERAYRKFVVIR